jgi:hypothetical protein
MEKEKFDEYLKDRYQNQISWYSKNARTNTIIFIFSGASLFYPHLYHS